MEIEEFLKEKFSSANSIVIFGSYVRGERFNDIDVLVIGDFSEEYVSKVFREFFFKFRRILHIVNLTKEEFFMNVYEKNPFFLSVFIEGKVLKDDGTFFQGKMIFKRIAGDMVLVKGGRRWSL